ncbi:MAG: ylaC [Verrucomicrobiales bacterium]|nr:ylaC [Verrucomicrobiales bacterium]
MNATEQQSLFDAWLRRHAGIPHHVAHGFAEGADREDLMQELLIALWKSIPAFRGGCMAPTFIYRVCHNAALTWRRAGRNRERRMERYRATSEAALDGARPPDAGAGEGSGSGSAGEADAVLLEQLYGAIRRLPDLERSLILLALDGLTYREMAEVHGIGESNVGVRLHRARQRLGVLLGQTQNQNQPSAEETTS